MEALKPEVAALSGRAADETASQGRLQRAGPRSRQPELRLLLGSPRHPGPDALPGPPRGDGQTVNLVRPAPQVLESLGVMVVLSRCPSLHEPARSQGFPIPADNFPSELARVCDSVGKSPA